MKWNTQWCRNCGLSLVGDDQGGWLHQYNMLAQCPPTYAEPRNQYA